MLQWIKNHGRGVAVALLIGEILSLCGEMIFFTIGLTIKHCTGEQPVWVLISYWISFALFWAFLISGHFMDKYNQKQNVTKIFTHNIAAELIDIFEDVLDEHDITIPDEEREGNDDEARIYGKVYTDLLYITEMALVRRIAPIVAGNDKYRLVIDEFE